MAPLFEDVFDTSQNIWALWAEYDIAYHRERQRERHPGWSERALVNPRHWQGTVRKFLREKAQQLLEIAAGCQPRLRDSQGFFYTTCPEAMGVNVTATMKNVGVRLEWPPKEITRLIYLAGVKK
jgi:hypothetical protein